jgi:acetoin:2,6-dichlorophenolindophenol oxidoreductase subunit alpha
MVSKKVALELYEHIFRIRKCEERIRADYANDEMKTPVHLHIGAEGISAGVLQALPRGTKIFASYRNHAPYLTITKDPKIFFAELYGKTTGCAQGKAGSMHLTAPEQGLVLTSAVVATPIPVAVGAAFANQYKDNKDFVVVFFGDGAVEEGAFWESLNFACLKKLKIVFVCEDNGLAIYTPAKDRQGFESMEKAVSGFHCYFSQTDGERGDAVYEATRNLARKMNKDPKPGFLHCPYFRFFEHVGMKEDFDQAYRKEPSEEEKRTLDPLHWATVAALEAGVQEKELSKIDEMIADEINRAVEYAKTAPFPRPDSLYEDVLS